MPDTLNAQVDLLLPSNTLILKIQAGRQVSLTTFPYSPHNGHYVEVTFFDITDNDLTTLQQKLAEYLSC